MKIDYLGHSGFLAETDGALLLFDYYRGGLAPLEAAPPDKPLFAFVSHAHPDHFNPQIFSLAGGVRPVQYILSFDLKGNPAVEAGADVLYTEADAAYEIPGLGEVRTLRSTDEGVAFLVRTPDKTLFHAGDLNWWDWTGEDPKWLAEQKIVFQREIGTLAGEAIDAAFLVLDDRLEENFAEGPSWFLSVCRPAFVLPMHFWDDRSVVARFREVLPDAQKRETVILNTAEECHWEL